MKVHDYNGSGKWSVAAVQARHAQLSRQLGVVAPHPVSPRVFEDGQCRWIYPVMDAVIDGIHAADMACATLAVELIEEGKKLPFGATLKARAARALRKVTLPEPLQARIRRRVLSMVCVGEVPREVREYLRLLRTIGFDALWPEYARHAPLHNPYAMRHFRYLEGVHARSPAFVPHRPPAGKA